MRYRSGTEEVLQQACDYQGVALVPERTAGRTFPAKNATIGLAYQCRRVVRSKRRVSKRLLETTMAGLRLNDASSKMAKEVGFILAIPLFEPERDYTFPQPVVAVIYIDSDAPGFFVDDKSFVDPPCNRSAVFPTVFRGRPLPTTSAEYETSAFSDSPETYADEDPCRQCLPIIGARRRISSHNNSSFSVQFRLFGLVPTQIRPI